MVPYLDVDGKMSRSLASVGRLNFILPTMASTKASSEFGNGCCKLLSPETA